MRNRVEEAAHRIEAALQFAFPDACIRHFDVGVDSGVQFLPWKKSPFLQRYPSQCIYEIRIEAVAPVGGPVPWQSPIAAAPVARTQAGLLIPESVPVDPRAQRVHELYIGGKSIDDLLRWFPSLTRGEVEAIVASSR